MIRIIIWPLWFVVAIVTGEDFNPVVNGEIRLCTHGIRSIVRTLCAGNYANDFTQTSVRYHRGDNALLRSDIIDVCCKSQCTLAEFASRCSRARRQEILENTTPLPKAIQPTVSPAERMRLLRNAMKPYPSSIHGKPTSRARVSRYSDESEGIHDSPNRVYRYLKTFAEGGAGVDGGTRVNENQRGDYEVTFLVPQFQGSQQGQSTGYASVFEAVPNSVLVPVRVGDFEVD